MCLDNIQDMSESDNYFVFAKLDDNDPEIEAYKKRLHEYPELIVEFGKSDGKIHAINRGLEKMPHFDIICCHSDDMKFIEWGFDGIIREHCTPNTYLHFPDGHANERLCTYSIMSRDYFEKFGYIYCPEYKSVYADNEQMEVAKISGSYKFVNKHILRHEHPAWGYGIADDLLRRTEASDVYNEDRNTYHRRKQNNFYL